MNALLRLLLPALVAVAALALLGCSSAENGSSETESTESTESSEAPEPTAKPTPDSEPVELPDEQFCAGGNAFVTDTRTRLIATPNAATFVDIDDQLEQLFLRSPGEVADSVADLRDGFIAIGEAYAATGFDPAATLTLDPEIQDANAVAGSSLRSYLLANCDLTATRDEQVEQIVIAFGIEDATTAECLHAQLGDIANIDPSGLTPELMTTPVCGTSILGLLSGETTASDG